MATVKKIEFSLLENALDYIISAQTYILSKNPRDLKYAVLHLSAAVELILKKRLQDEHWSLVFEDINTANVTNYESGDFISVNLKTCILRLSGVCNVIMPEKDKEIISSFRKKRNRLEHFGVTDSVEAITSSAAEVLSILLDFIKMHLETSKFSITEKHALSIIRKDLCRFELLVDKRMKKISSQLKKAEKKFNILSCPSCLQNALVVGDDDPTCIFCHYSGKPKTVAVEWIETILGIDYYLAKKDGTDYPLHTCCDCGYDSLVKVGPTGDSSIADQYVCFNCGQKWSLSDIGECQRCNELYFVKEDDVGECLSCQKYRLTKDD